MYKFATILTLLIIVFSCQSNRSDVQKTEDLTITIQDIEIAETESGFILYVRAKPDIKSIKLYPHTHDPKGENDVFGYKSKTYNKINGNESFLVGKDLIKNDKYFFLIDSTPEPHYSFDFAFSILIPDELVYGYKHIGNETVINLEAGTYINICTFPLKYASHRNGYQDNPFNLALK